MAWELRSTDRVRIYCADSQTEAVRLAARNLAADIGRVLGAAAGVCHEGKEACQIIIEDRWEQEAAWGEKPHKEAYLHRVKDGSLRIAGADRRGTVYGIYELSEWMGVSPWYFFADVPVRKRERLTLPEGYYKTDYPSVEYRGVFINDEEELEKWVRLHMGEETIGVKTYEKIFELLLRMKGNYIWPAMHVNSFNQKRENGELANRMGIVVGTSHCDMLMRSNNREWLPWLQKKGYEDVEYDYSIPGRNREILKEYWRESVEQNRDFEVGYTLGMRGIHDSGFETKTFEGLAGEELQRAKIGLLQTVINDQEEILKETLTGEPLKSFVPYKEVLPLYDNGLEVPEDLTLIWTNDNYGYIRRYPGEKEKKRKGGNGIYYHNSYWAPPGASYLFINSIPLAHTRNELYKAWREGIRRVWVMNVGAIKPLEQEISFYLRFAWEVGKENPLTGDVDRYLAWWIDSMFSGSHGEEMADVLNSFSQLTNVRKIELMDSDVFSQTAYGDEAAGRLNRYYELVRRADAVYEALPKEERDAFFQLCLMKLHAAYFTNCMYYYGDRSGLCVKQGKYLAADKYTGLCRKYDDRRRRLLEYYNNVLCGGKWSGIVTPEDFPPPRTAMLPACVPSLKDPSKIEKKLVVTVWNGEKGIHFVSAREKWVELANAGAGELSFKISGPDWLKVWETQGTVAEEKRILVCPDRESVGRIRESEKEIAGDLEGNLEIFCPETGQRSLVPVSLSHAAFGAAGEKAALEDGKAVSIPAEGARELRQEGARKGAWDVGTDNIGWRVIPRLGRDRGVLVEAQERGIKPLNFDFRIWEDSPEPLLEIHRFPSLNSTGRIRVEVSVDGGEAILVESDSTDEWRGSWKTNVLNNVDKLYAKLPPLGAGAHTVTLGWADKYFAFSRLVIYTAGRKENMLGAAGEEQNGLPQEYSSKVTALYEDIPLKPRPMYCDSGKGTENTLPDTDIRVEQGAYGKTITPKEILAQGKNIFCERDGSIRIDAAAALAQTENACTANGKWDYCASESYGRTGLAMLIRRPGLRFAAGKAPSLNYRIYCEGGEYTLWLLMKTESYDEALIGAEIDGTCLEEKELWGGTRLGRYCGERIYRWVPMWKRRLSKGEHRITVNTLASRNRFDRIYITNKDELPPTDEYWR